MSHKFDKTIFVTRDDELMSQETLDEGLKENAFGDGEKIAVYELKAVKKVVTPDCAQTLED